MSFLTAPLLTAALIATIYAAVVIVVRSFSTSLHWGLVTVLVPFGFYAFIFKHWEEGRRPFFLHLFSLPVLVFFWVVPTVQAFSHRQAVAAQGPRIDAEITRLQQESVRLQQEADAQTASLVPIYDDLAKRRAQLTPGDPQATADFNREAVAYTARRTQRDALRKEAEDDDVQAAILLAKRAELAAKNKGVIIYGTGWCPACKMARNYLNSKGVAYRDVDVEHSPEGAAEFHQRGGGGVPMIVINGEQQTGFNSRWVDAHLQ